MRRKWLVKTPLVAVHGDPIGGPLSSINNDHVAGDDAMAMATMQGENSPLSLSWSPSRMMAPFRMLWWGRRLDVLHCEAQRALLALPDKRRHAKGRRVSNTRCDCDCD
jgi:hypothetical protein